MCRATMSLPAVLTGSMHQARSSLCSARACSGSGAGWKGWRTYLCSFARHDAATSPHARIPDHPEKPGSISISRTRSLDEMGLKLRALPRTGATQIDQYQNKERQKKAKPDQIRKNQKSTKNNGLATVKQNPLLDMPLNSASQRDTFNIPPDGCQLLRRHAVIDPLDFLLDDGPFIQIGRHIMRGRTDQLHASIKSLVIGLGPLETRQKRVVNIDRPTSKTIAQLRRKNLHIPREHNKIRLMLVDHLEHARFLRSLRIRRGRSQRKMMKGNVIARRKLIKRLVVRNDCGNLDRQLPRAITEQQIVQTMPDLRHHDHDARFHCRVMQLPPHAELLRQRPERLAQHLQPRIAAHLLEMHAHEELTGVAVAELRGVENVAAALEQEAGDRVDNAWPVGARQFENKAVIGRHDLGDSLLQCVIRSV